MSISSRNGFFYVALFASPLISTTSCGGANTPNTVLPPQSATAAAEPAEQEGPSEHPSEGGSATSGMNLPGGGHDVGTAQPGDRATMLQDKAIAVVAGGEATRMATAIADRQAEENKAFDAAKPVFEKYCASCHQQGGKHAKAKTLAQLDITMYPFTGAHVDEMTKLIRRDLGIDGSKPTMPKSKPGTVRGDELNVISIWADAYDQTHSSAMPVSTP